MRPNLVLCTLLLVLAACAPSAPSSTLPTVMPRAAQPTAAVGLDLKSVDVCALVPKADIESVLGPLGKEPKADPPNGSEKGCIYYNQQGEYADILLNPVEDWNLLRQLQPDAQDMALNGDAAFSRTMFSDTAIWVLHPGKAIVHIRVSTKSLEQAQKLVPKVIARLP